MAVTPVVSREDSVKMRELTHDLFDGKVSLEDYRAKVKKFTKYQLKLDLKKKG